MMPGKFILHAPSVHTGGGLVLLRSLLTAWPAGEPLQAFLDSRARSGLVLPPMAQVHWVQPTLPSRFAGERRLKAATGSSDTVLCFHGLPPVYRSAGRVLVFAQNRIHLGLTPLRRFGLRTAARLAAERVIARAFRGHVDEYVVQTPTMAGELERWHARRPQVRVLPFADPVAAPRAGLREWDFVYVADGGAHKNHDSLLRAWSLLAEQGIRPRLALTLGERDGALIERVEALRRTGIEVHNLGVRTHDQVMSLYAASRALVYPSFGESFGLPLIEARRAGIPILAPELDYVRDVCDPVHTFDPKSPVSIARAVRRFLGCADPALEPGTARAFWQQLLAPGEAR
jgi:glycosyltransferase involved in cell wall biosynthesis